MTQAAAARATRPAARPSTTRSAPPPGRRLRVVSPPVTARSRAGAVVVCLAILAAGLVALLLINIDLGHGAYTMYTLQNQQKQLADQKEALGEQIAAAQAPDQLALRANALGMVPAPDVSFLHLSDGRITGAAAPASPTARLTVKSTP